MLHLLDQARTSSNNTLSKPIFHYRRQNRFYCRGKTLIIPQAVELQRPVTGREETLKSMDAVPTAQSSYLPWHGMVHSPQDVTCSLAVSNTVFKTSHPQLQASNHLIPPITVSTFVNTAALCFLSRDSKHFQQLMHVGLIQAFAKQNPMIKKKNNKNKTQ